MVAKPVSRKDRLLIEKARAACAAEWERLREKTWTDDSGKLRKGAWDEEKVEEWSAVCKQGRKDTKKKESKQERRKQRKWTVRLENYCYTYFVLFYAAKKAKVYIKVSQLGKLES